MSLICSQESRTLGLLCIWKMLARQQILVNSLLKYHTRAKTKRETCCIYHDRIDSHAHGILTRGAKRSPHDPPAIPHRCGILVYETGVGCTHSDHCKKAKRGPEVVPASRGAQEGDERDRPRYAVMVPAQVEQWSRGIRKCSCYLVRTFTSLV